MKKSKFTETQIVKALKEHEGGRTADDICNELGICVIRARRKEIKLLGKYKCNDSFYTQEVITSSEDGTNRSNND